MMLARIYIGSRIRPLLDGNVWVQHPDTTGKSLQADAQGEQVCTIMNPKKDVRLKQAKAWPMGEQQKLLSTLAQRHRMPICIV